MTRIGKIYENKYDTQNMMHMFFFYLTTQSIGTFILVTFAIQNSCLVSFSLTIKQLSEFYPRSAPFSHTRVTDIDFSPPSQMLTSAPVHPVRTVEDVWIRLGDTLVSVEGDSQDKTANLVRKNTFKP